MKLFMMPQTVPNRPTKGAVAPMVASTPVPRFMSRPAATSRRASRVAIRSLMPALSTRSADMRSSSRAASIRAGAMPRRVADAGIGIGERTLAVAERRERPAQSARRQPKLDVLGEPYGPSHERGEHQADHDGLHEDVGRHEHRPRRQVARQLRAADDRHLPRRRSWQAAGRGSCRQAGRRSRNVSHASRRRQASLPPDRDAASGTTPASKCFIPRAGRAQANCLRPGCISHAQLFTCLLRVRNDPCQGRARLDLDRSIYLKASAQ